MWVNPTPSPSVGGAPVGVLRSKENIVNVTWKNGKLGVAGIPNPPTWEKHLRGSTWDYLLPRMLQFDILGTWKAIPRVGDGDKLHAVSVVWKTHHTYHARRDEDTTSWLGWEWELPIPLRDGESATLGIPNKTTLFGIPTN